MEQEKNIFFLCSKCHEDTDEKRKRLEVLQELVDQAQELDMGY